MFKLDLEKAEEPEIKLPTSTGSSKKQEFQKNIYFCFIDYAKAFNCVDLTEAEDIKKKWHEYTEEIYRKDLSDPDNHDGVITHMLE